MKKTVEAMMEYVCDNICRYPYATENQEDLDERCAECLAEQHVKDILNTYNSSNRRIT